MNNILKGLTYSYHRNIGWQDRTIRTIFGLLSLAGAIFFYKSNPGVAAACAVLVFAQGITVLSSRCMICYFLGRCTITTSEKKSLDARGIPREN